MAVTSKLYYVTNPGTGTGSPSDAIDSATLFNGTSSTLTIDTTGNAGFLEGLALDAPDDVYFVTVYNGSGSTSIYKETFGATPSFTTTIAPVQTTGVIGSLGVDAADHIVYFASGTAFDEVNFGSSFSNSPTAPVQLATLPLPVTQMVLDQANHAAYFTASKVSGTIGFATSKGVTSGTASLKDNFIYKVSGVTSTAPANSLTNITNVAVPLADGQVQAVALDTANDTLYFTTTVASGVTGSSVGIYSLALNNFTAANIKTVWSQTYTGPTEKIINLRDITVDPLTGDYYVSEQDQGNLPSTPSELGIFFGNINSATKPVEMIQTSTTTTNGATPFGLAIDNAPSVTSAAVTAIDGNTSLTTGQVTPSDTVTISVVFSAAVNVGGTAPTLTLNDGGVATYASGSGTSTLVFTYKPSGSQNTPTLASTGLVGTVTDNAGTPATTTNAAATFAGLSVDTKPPTLTLTGTTTDAVQGGNSLDLLASAPSISDPTGTGTLTAASVVITGNDQTGDKLGINGAASGSLTFGGSTITYSFAAATLTLSGSASIADYQTAFAEVTYQDTGTDGTVGPHPIRNISWTVSESSLTSTAQISTLIIDRVPTLASGGFTTLVAQGATGAGSSGAVLAGDSDLDGDALTITAVSAGATPGVLGSALAGTYGALTLNANGSYSYAATNTTAINAAATGSQPVDTFTITVADGQGGTGTEAVKFDIARPDQLSGGGNTVTYHTTNSNVVVDPGLILSSPDATNVTGASVTVSAGLLTGDALNFTNQNGISGSFAGGTLTLTGAASAANYQTALDSITYSSSSTNPNNSGADNTRTISFSALNAASTSNVITSTIDATTACYCHDTMILTDQGEVPVQALRIGDRVVTHGGTVRPIHWIGRRSYAGRFAARNPAVLPIRIAAGALAEGVPARDLFVSPAHAMHLDGRLIVAADLVNGVSITQLRHVETVEYFHVELETHDIIMAEGAPAESFLDDDNRAMFDNAAEYKALYPDALYDPPRPCAPRISQGLALQNIRERLERRSGAVSGPADQTSRVSRQRA